MTKYQLTTLLFMKGCARIDHKGIVGYLVNVEREDGSGRIFNLTVRTDDGKTVKLCVRTID